MARVPMWSRSVVDGEPRWTTADYGGHTIKAWRRPGGGYQGRLYADGDEFTTVAATLDDLFRELVDAHTLAVRRAEAVRRVENGF